MLKEYTKKVILFPAGASGNFLAAFLTEGTIFVAANNRIDLGQQLSSSVFITGSNSLDKRFIDSDSDVCLQNIKNSIISGSHQVILSHYQKVSNLVDFCQYAWIKKVSPAENVFGWLKNIVYKKQYIEQADIRHVSYSHQVDENFIHLQTWYDINQLDLDRPSDMTIDFSKIHDINYLISLYQSANGNQPDDSRIKFAEEYISKQFLPLGDCKSTSMTDIIKHVTPRDPFDIATVLFIYEKNHNTLDRNRLWTIDNLPNTIPDCIEFLIANEKNYTFF